MVTDYFEPFALLEKTGEPDGLGGAREAWRYGMSFRGVLTHEPGSTITAAGQQVLQCTPVLLHEFDVTLVPGDHVRRERDGSLWRVCACSAQMRTPDISNLQFAQVRVERVVLPC